jgi:hypothetical protein
MRRLAYACAALGVASVVGAGCRATTPAQSQQVFRAGTDAVRLHSVCWVFVIR